MAAFVATCKASGYRSLTPGQVTELAGLPGPSFHRYFASGSDCLLAVYEEASAWFGAAIGSAVDGCSDWVAAVALGTAAALDLAATDPELTCLGAIDLRYVDGPTDARRGDDLRCLAAFLRRGREDCPRGDELPPLLEDSLIAGALFVVGYHSRRGSLEPSGLAREITYCLLVPYLGQAEALRVAALPRPGATR